MGRGNGRLGDIPLKAGMLFNGYVIEVHDENIEGYFHSWIIVIKTVRLKNICENMQYSFRVAILLLSNLVHLLPVLIEGPVSCDILCQSICFET